jgi:hypothetical protein
MYDDILGEVDKIREIKNRKFNIEQEEKEEEEFGIFEELALEFDYD